MKISRYCYVSNEFIGIIPSEIQCEKWLKILTSAQAVADAETVRKAAVTFANFWKMRLAKNFDDYVRQLVQVFATMPRVALLELCKLNTMPAQFLGDFEPNITTLEAYSREAKIELTAKINAVKRALAHHEKRNEINDKAPVVKRKIDAMAIMKGVA